MTFQHFDRRTLAPAEGRAGSTVNATKLWRSSNRKQCTVTVALLAASRRDRRELLLQLGVEDLVHLAAQNVLFGVALARNVNAVVGAAHCVVVCVRQPERKKASQTKSEKSKKQPLTEEPRRGPTCTIFGTQSKSPSATRGPGTQENELRKSRRRRRQIRRECREDERGDW